MVSEAVSRLVVYFGSRVDNVRPSVNFWCSQTCACMEIWTLMCDPLLPWLLTRHRAALTDNRVQVES